MAGISDKQLLPELGPWPAGIDNMSPETALTRSDDGKKVIALREAVNVDLDKAGWPRGHRPGRERVVECTSGHSFFGAPQFPYLLFCDGTTMYGWTPGNDPFDLVDSLFNAEVSYAQVSDRVFWSNGRDTGIVLSTGMNVAWGVETPAGQPNLSLGDGALPAGNYQVAITFRTGQGEESGTPLAANIDAIDKSAIVLSNIPQPTQNDVTTIRVYMSQANGDVLYFQRDLPRGMTTVTLPTYRGTIPLATQLLRKMPPGTIVRYMGGRMYVAAGDSLIWSEAMRYGQYNPAENRVRIGAGLRMIEPVGEATDGVGMYASDAKRVMWLSGWDPWKWAAKRVCDAPAIPGSSVVVSGKVWGFDTNEPVAYWLGADGVAYVGMPGGQIVPLRQDQVAGPTAEGAASYFREGTGMRQIITALRRASPIGMSLTDRVVDKVYRNGVEV
ncbi:MAG TPA: hypothetical protein VLE97_01860 [Gaiellaceae bacterium]|nr:hypothetical protein [Gaiellaceae bacterium]